MKRAVFWGAFSLVAVAAFIYIWTTQDPLRRNPYLLPFWVKHNVRLLAHPHPAVAEAAWLELWNLYFTKWTAYQMFPGLVEDHAPISFLMERKSFPAGGGPDVPAMEGFFAGRKPIYYKAEQVCCRTVGEAVMAIMYREKKWTTDQAAEKGPSAALGRLGARRSTGSRPRAKSRGCGVALLRLTRPAAPRLAAGPF
jgi:hypothetical protein